MIKHYIFVLKKKYDRYIHDPIIAVVTIPLFMVLKLLPYTISSDLCGIIFKKIGPLTKYQTRINNNLRFAFPNKKSKELDFISRECWYNFGQIVGELPHIDTIIKKNKLKTVGLNKIKKGPAILIGAHIGNWEFLLRVAELAGRRAGFV